MTRTLTLLTFFFCLAMVPAWALTVSVTTGPARCGLANGTLLATANGGVPPYTYAWDNGITGAQLTGVAAGTYTVWVSDASGETASASGTVTDVFNMTLQVVNERSDCDSACTGIVRIVPGGGQTPITMTVDGPAGWDLVLEGNVHRIRGLCGFEPYNIAFTDANGCPAQVDLNLPGVPLSPQIFNPQPGSIQVLGATAACGEAPNGTVTINHAVNWTKYRLLGANTGTDLIRLMTSPLPRTIDALPADTYTIMPLIMLQDGTFEPAYCSAPTTFTVEGLPAPCGAMEGRLFIDVDTDCAFGGDDIGLPNKVLLVQPDGSPVITDGQGRFQRALPAGSYTLEHAVADFEQSCPSTGAIAFDVVENTPATAVLVGGTSASGFDLSVVLSSTALRPGFPTRVYVTVCNGSPFPVEAVQVALDWNLPLQLPVDEDGLWTIPSLAPFACHTLLFDAELPPDVGLLGQVEIYSATVSSVLEELEEANNGAQLAVTVTGSYDPNDKQGFALGQQSQLDEFPGWYFTNVHHLMDYTIRFQNTGTDTAFTVVVRDVLDEMFDLTSLQVLGTSHAVTPSFEEDRTLVFTFNNILLPDSGTDQLGSNGFVHYRIKPVEMVDLGQELRNTAAIYFDFNAPIITDTVVHVVSVIGAVGEQGQHDRLHVRPNPTTDLLFVTLPEGADRSFRVLALDGRVVEVKGISTWQGLQLDVRSLAPGTYVVRTASGVARFVKR